MSTSEDCSQLSQGLQNSNEPIEQDSILSKDDEQLLNNQSNVIDSDNVNSSFVDAGSPNEIVTARQSDTLDSTASFQDSHFLNNNHATLDTTPDVHTIDLPPSSPDTLSQDSHNPEENGKHNELVAIGLHTIV